MLLIVQNYQERQYGRPPELDELFMATHTNKKGEWVDNRARETYVSYSFNFFYIYILIF